MDVILEYINSLEYDIYEFRNKLKNQRQYLKSIKDQTKYACVLREIREMTDENALETLIQRCDEREKECEDARYFERMFEIIKCIKNAHEQLNNKNVRPFYEHELNLLNTLHRITFKRDDGGWIMEWILNGMGCYFKIKLNCKNDDTFMQIASTFDYQNIAHNMPDSYAFGAKMTKNEYTDFIHNLVPSICLLYDGTYKFNNSYDVSYNPSINIADLLLCAIHEQYPINITLAEMNMADRVFYDTYLLKCSTSVKFL